MRFDNPQGVSIASIDLESSSVLMGGGFNQLNKTPSILTMQLNNIITRNTKQMFMNF